VVSVVEFESGRTAYSHIAYAVRHGGKTRAPRGMSTYDLGHVAITLDSPYDALPLEVGRKLNTAIAAAEAIQLIAGRAEHALMPRITPAFKQYAEPSGQFHGAYGDRIGAQVGKQLAKLKVDSDTRQAIVTLWDSERDNEPNRRDYPCTVALNFTIVDDTLELRTLMRSNDAWLGLPYDMFQFSQLQLTAARALNIPPGRYTHETWSLHLYTEHADLVDQLITPHDPGPYQPIGFGDDSDDWLHSRAHASIILAGDTAHLSLTKSEEWYVEQLAPYITA
jgi:thymidylate synthase